MGLFRLNRISPCLPTTRSIVGSKRSLSVAGSRSRRRFLPSICKPCSRIACPCKNSPSSIQIAAQGIDTLARRRLHHLRCSQETCAFERYRTKKSLIAQSKITIRDGSHREVLKQYYVQYRTLR